MPTYPTKLAMSAWRAPSRSDVFDVAGVLGILLIVVSLPLISIYATWSDRQAMRTAWNIPGPSCPVVAAPISSPLERRPLTVFQYGDVSFSRKFGHVSCVAPREGGLFQRTTYRVCQFTAPALIGVTTAERTVFYAPGVGRRATVAVRGDTPSCVLGGWFEG